VHGAINSPEMSQGHRFSDRLSSTGVVLERIHAGWASASSATPETETCIVNQRGDIGFIQETSICGGLLQIPVDVFGNAGYAIDDVVGQGFVPADFLIQLGTYTQSHRTGSNRTLGSCGRIEAHELWPDNH